MTKPDSELTIDEWISDIHFFVIAAMTDDWDNRLKHILRRFENAVLDRCIADVSRWCDIVDDDTGMMLGGIISDMRRLKHKENRDGE